MADKLKQLVSVFVNFVDGERPSAAKFNALSSQSRRALEGIEYAIGDIQNQSWPQNSPLLSIPYGTRWIQPELNGVANPDLPISVVGTSFLGRPLDIVNLSRLIGPASNINPQVLTDGAQEIQESLTSADAWGSSGAGLNQYALRYPPLFHDSIPDGQNGAPVFNDPSGNNTFSSYKTSPTQLSSPGDYHVSRDGLVTTYIPIPTAAEVTCTYKTDSLLWGGGPNYLGSTFNVIPDPNQILAGEGISVVGPDANGAYSLTLPTVSSSQKNHDATSVDLDAADHNYGKQLFLPTWMTGEDAAGAPFYTPGDTLPQGCIYLKCVSTNEIYSDATYIYNSPSTLKVTGIDLGENGCNLSYCLITVGTDITTSIDDLRRKQFQHSHDRRFGEPFIHISSIVGQLEQGDSPEGFGNALTPWSGPYLPSSIPGNYFPQYLHKDGFRFDEARGLNTNNAPGITSAGESKNCLRGNLVLGVRNYIEDLDSDGLTTTGKIHTNFGIDADGNQRTSNDPGSHGVVVDGEGVYTQQAGESFHISFGGIPAHHNHSVGAGPDGDEYGHHTRIRSDGFEWDKLNSYAPQIYRNHWTELCVESQGGFANGPSLIQSAFVETQREAYWAYAEEGVGNYLGSWSDPHAWGFDGAVDPLNIRHELKKERASPLGLGFYSVGKIVLDNANFGGGSNIGSGTIDGIHIQSGGGVHVQTLGENAGEFTVNAKGVKIATSEGDTFIHSKPGASSGRSVFSGKFLGLAFDSQGFGDDGGWVSNYQVFKDPLNIVSGTVPGDLGRGLINIHATSSGDNLGKILLTNNAGQPGFNPKAWATSSSHQNAAPGPPAAGVSHTFPISLQCAVKVDGSNTGLGLWDSFTDLPPGKNCENIDWVNVPTLQTAGTPNDVRQASHRYPRSAMLWVKRDIENTGAGRWDYVSVLEDSSNNWDAPAWTLNGSGAISGWQQQRGHSLLLSDTTRQKLGHAHYAWMTFKCRPDAGEYGTLGVIRSGMVRNTVGNPQGGGPSLYDLGNDQGDGPPNEPHQDQETGEWVGAWSGPAHFGPGGQAAIHYYHNEHIFQRIDIAGLEGIGVDFTENNTSANNDALAGQALAVYNIQYADNDVDDSIPSIFGDGYIQYVSGGADYGEALLIGDINEWPEDTHGHINLDIPEGYIVWVREGKVWRNGSGTPMVVTHRSVVVGNETEETRNKHHVICSFIGQVPVYTVGKVKDGDLLVPVEGENFARAISKDDISFSDYKNAIGTVFQEFPEELQEEIDRSLIVKVMCAISIK